MTDSDIVILRFLYETGVALPPTPLEYNLSKNHEISYSTVRRRTRRLEEEGLLTLEDPDKKYYSLSEEGRKFVEDNLLGGEEAADLEPSEDA